MPSHSRQARILLPCSAASPSPSFSPPPPTPSSSGATSPLPSASPRRRPRPAHQPRPCPRSAADAITGLDGSYEIRTDLAGRFLLLTAPSVLNPSLAPQIGHPFYGGRTDLLTRDIHLDPTAISPQLTTLATLIPTPLRQLSTPPTQILADRLLPEATPIPNLRSTPGAFLVQLGQLGTPATLYLRGAPVTKTLIDGISAEDLGGPFNLGPLTATGLAAPASTPALELTSTPTPTHFLDASAGVLSLQSPTASTPHPVLTYTGGAGNLSTTRNEATVTLAHTRADLFASFSRLNTDNDLPAARLHLITSAANLGYHISAATSLRLTLRDDTSATPLSLPFSFYNLQPLGKQAAQNLYSAFTFDTRSAGNWHSLLRYGLARKRAQTINFFTPPTGLPVIILGANGYSAAGTAPFPAIPPREDFVTNRDEFTLQTDRPITHFLTALLTARYQDERAADLLPPARQALARTHLSFAAALQGDIRHRLFYQASGFLDRSPIPLTGSPALTGAPSLGLTYVPVRPGPRRLRGTSLHLTAATGTRELTLAEQASLPNPPSPRSRTFVLAVDQDLLPRKLFLRAAYFHNQFSHETEPLTLAPLTFSNALAYRTQGLETELRYQPSPRFQLRGGYTYLAALVEQSATTPVFNPSLLNIPVGALSALPGARPFHRPPQTGFAQASFSGRLLSANIKSAFASTSDDSTNLYLNRSLLLPNRDLSPAYAALDADLTFTVTHHITLYSELNNLLDSRNLAPIGYLSTPFSAQVGLRLRLGRE